jgi:hypothetical protein
MTLESWNLPKWWLAQDMELVVGLPVGKSPIQKLFRTYMWFPMMVSKEIV